MTTVEIDDRLFEYNCSMSTTDGLVPINKSAIKYMEITESVFTRFAEGFVVLYNDQSIIDATLKLTGDISDMLLFELHPLDPMGSIPEKSFKMHFAFSIYRVDDAPGETYPDSCKIVYFREIDSQIMYETKCTFASTDYLEEQGTKAEEIEKFNNSQRAVETGILIKELLKKDIKFADGNFHENWDDGKFKLMFNATGNNSVVKNSVDWLMQYHVSKEESTDACLMKYERYDKKLSLLSLSKYFEFQEAQPEIYTLETLVLGGAGGFNESSSPKNKFGLFLADVSNVIASSVSRPYNQLLKNRGTQKIPVSIVGTQKNQRMFFTEKHNIEKIYEDYKKYYVDPFQHVSTGSVEPELTLNELKTSLKSFELVQTELTDDHCMAVGRNKVLNSLIFLGSCCTLTVRGSTHRSSGRFFDLAKLGTSQESLLDKQTYGRWFITKCKHIFSFDKYTNHIEAVKTYRNS